MKTVWLGAGTAMLLACGGGAAETPTTTTPTQTTQTTQAQSGGGGLSCFLMIGYMCFHGAERCTEARTNIYNHQKADGASAKDLEMIGACESKPNMWCHDLQAGSDILWCGGGDEEGKGQCESHLEAMQSSMKCTNVTK